MHSEVLTKNPNNPLILSITDTSYYVIFSNKRYICSTTSSSCGSDIGYPGKPISQDHFLFQISENEFSAVYFGYPLIINYYHMSKIIQVTKFLKTILNGRQILQIKIQLMKIR